MPAKSGERQRKPAEGRASGRHKNPDGNRHDALHGGNISPPCRVENN